MAANYAQDAESRLMTGKPIESGESNGIDPASKAALGPESPSFPLDGCVKEGDNLGKEMMEELEKSWNTNMKLRNATSEASCVHAEPPILHALFVTELKNAQKSRAEVER